MPLLPKEVPDAAAAASAPATTICLECIDLCLEIIEEEAAEERDTGPSSG